jgi:hypothetical protein
LTCEKDIYPSGKGLGGAAEPSGRCGKENRLRSVRTYNVHTVVPSGNIYISLCTLQPGTISLEASNVMAVVAGNSKTFLVVHVKYSIFLSDCNHIWNSTDLHRISQYQISRKSVLWEPR